MGKERSFKSATASQKKRSLIDNRKHLLGTASLTAPGTCGVKKEHLQRVSFLLISITSIWTEGSISCRETVKVCNLCQCN